MRNDAKIPRRQPNRRARLLATLVCAFAAMAASGCVKKPSVTLDHADVAGVRVRLPPSVGLLLEIHLDVANPNSFDVAVRAVRGQVVLAGRHVVPVDFEAPGDGVWLASDATTRVVVPVEIPLQTSLAILGESASSPVVPYTFTGSADVTASRTFEVEQDDYAVNEAGVITREQMQAGLHIAL